MLAPSRAPLAREAVPVPAGAFSAGSTPGEPGRDPALEPIRRSVELGGFEIDKLPWPNDPAQPPMTNVGRDEAVRLCQTRGARLCTELEWERACAGAEGRRYPTGDAWLASCAEAPNRCAAPSEALALGTLREWTAGESGDQAVLRGAAPDAAGPDHRCARRTLTAPASGAPDLGFRCCHGAPNAAVLAVDPLGPAFRKSPLELAKLTKLLEADVRTRELAANVRYFEERESVRAVLEKGTADRQGFEFGTTPLEWQPSPGVRLLVVLGRSGKETSFLLVYHRVGASEALAASFIMRREPGPLVLAYSESIRPRLHFSSCWGCLGESGKIIFRKPERIVIAQP